MELESNYANKLAAFQREMDGNLQTVEGKLADYSAKFRKEIEEKDSALRDIISTRSIFVCVNMYVCMYASKEVFVRVTVRVIIYVYDNLGVRKT